MKAAGRSSDSPVKHARCSCCGCHTLSSRGGACALCLWSADEHAYALEEARTNVERYGVIYRPSDARFAVVRHPILGPAGEYAIDRVALRARAYIEFRTYGAGKPARVVITERLHALLQTIRAADRLYIK